jgi:hypothetical protein
MADEGNPPPEKIVSLDEAADSEFRRDRDGIASLRDTEAESGDEDEVADLYAIDTHEAREVGADLDDGSADEPLLD